MIPMNKKIVITLSLLTVLCLSLTGQALAQAWSPGVKPGDYFTYSVSTYWNSSNSSRTVPVYLLENNNTKWYNVSVSRVSGNNVTATNSWEYNNGTRGNSLVDMDVATGEVLFAIQGLPAFQGFFASNLNSGDLLRPILNENETVRIDRTITREYLSGGRDTNVANTSYAVTDYYNSTIGTETVTFYIDKATGALVERINYVEFPDETGSIEWKLIDTNAWVVSGPQISLPLPLPIIIAIIIAIIIVIVVALFFRGRRHSKKKR